MMRLKEFSVKPFTKRVKGVAPVGDVRLIAILLGVAGVILLMLIWGKPAPVAAGQCTANCNSKVIYPDRSFNPANFDNSICGDSTCLIEKVEYMEGGYTQQLYGYKVTCKCCVCAGAAQAGLGICNYKFSFLNSIGAWLGMCRTF